MIVSPEPSTTTDSGPWPDDHQTDLMNWLIEESVRCSATTASGERCKVTRKMRGMEVVAYEGDTPPTMVCRRHREQGYTLAEGTAR